MANSPSCLPGEFSMSGSKMPVMAGKNKLMPGMPNKGMTGPNVTKDVGAKKAKVSRNPSGKKTAKSKMK